VVFSLLLIVGVIRGRVRFAAVTADMASGQPVENARCVPASTTREPVFAGAWEARSIGGSDATPSTRVSVPSLDCMDHRSEIREFLATRRAKITPEQAGIPLYGGRRRVPGLRREEVAMLAGVSTDYYVRLEKGNVGGVSDEVLAAVARALHFDEAERDHLFDLARAARPSRARPPRRRNQARVRPSVQWMLDAMPTAAAFVRNGRLDVVAINSLGRAFYSPMFDGGAEPVNFARFCFLDPRSHELYPDWDGAANVTVAQLRMEAGRDPLNRDLSDLVGELATRSEEFRSRWAAHNVRLHHAGVKQFAHPVVGAVEVAYNAMDLPSDPGLVLTVYTAEPGSASEDALRLLASWAATHPAASLASPPDPDRNPA
jgi:transcriptional regulator with XRE-family HTH domain